MNRRRGIIFMIGAGALAIPLPALAQAPARPARIGIMEFGAAPDSAFVRAYVKALAALGYAEPATLHI